MIKKILILFCITFTLTTLASCIINLSLKNLTDTYIHIIIRAILCLTGSIVINFGFEIKFPNKILAFIIPYLIFIALAFLTVFISGIFIELHPRAYLDIFLNDSIAYIIIYTLIILNKKFNIIK